MHDRQSPVQIQTLLRDLASPTHAASLRDRSRRPIRGKEADLALGCRIDVGAFAEAGTLRLGLDDFRRFLSVCMGLRARSAGYPIRLVGGAPDGCPAGAPEAFAVSVQPSGCEITAAGADGFRRALIWLEDEMALRRAPCLPLGTRARWAVVVDRITHSPCSAGRWGTGWELEDDEDYYPNEYLNKLAHCGVNGIWVAGLLRRLVASKVLPDLGPRRHGLGKLKRLVERAAGYGIRVFLFAIEPRGVPHDHPVFRAHPEIKGATLCDVTSALCTSTPLVREYIRDVMRTLFTEVPDLSGTINIFSGERGTTCWLDPQAVKTCPRCRRRTQSAVLAEDLTCFMEGIRQASAEAKLLAWTYCMETSDSMTEGAIDPMLHTIAQADPRIVWLGNFEHGGSKHIQNKTIGVHEYSLSYVGPSPSFRRIAKAATARGARRFAKLQMGTTYELSSVPYLPVPGIVHDKFAGMRELGVDGAMLSWIIGGYPGLMLKAAGESAFAPARSRQEMVRRLAACSWGARAAPRVARAWEHLAAALKLYPNINQVLYFSPVTRSPAYHLDLRHETRLASPYNWGLDMQRRRQPYEDQVSRWIGPFTAEELIRQFRTVGRRWERGLAILRDCAAAEPRSTARRRQLAVASAAHIQFLSTANVIEFYARRDVLAAAPRARQRALLARLQTIVRDDMALAREMKRSVAADCFVGFESEMVAYSYSRELLDEKIRQCRETLRLLDRWIKTGERPATLEDTVPIPVESRNDTTPANRAYDDWVRYCYQPDTWQGPVPALPSYREWLQYGD